METFDTNNDHLIPLMIGMSLFVVIEIAILIIFVVRIIYIKPIKSRKSVTKNKGNQCNFNITITIICMICCILTGIVDIYHLNVGRIDRISDIYSLKYNIIIVVADIFYFTLIVLLYVIIIDRVYTTFNKTIYQLNKYIVILFGVLVFMIMICQFIYLGLYAFKIGTEKERDVFWFAIVSFDIIMNITLLVIFIKKLRALIIDFTDTKALSVNLLDKNDKNSNNRTYKFLKLMTKVFVLTIYIVIFNQFPGLFDIFCVYILKESNNFIKGLGYFMRSIQGFINCIVLYLTFKINDSLYHKLCCLCDHMIYMCLTKDTQKLLNKKFAQQSSNQTDKTSIL